MHIVSKRIKLGLAGITSTMPSLYHHYSITVHPGATFVALIVTAGIVVVSAGSGLTGLPQWVLVAGMVFALSSYAFEFYFIPDVSLVDESHGTSTVLTDPPP